MLRILGAVALLCSLGLVAPSPALSAVAITLTASSTTLDDGEPVTFAGRARNARLGSVVRLQRRADDSWVTVASRTLRSTRAFSFRVTPPRGRPAYRVLKPRGLGQPRTTSDVVRLTVRWQPTLTATAGHYLDDRQRSVTTITLGHSGLGGVTVTERRRVPVEDTGSGFTSWVATGRTVTLPADGTIRVERIRESRGTLFVYDAPAAGPRRAVSSNVAAVAVAPLRYDLSSGALPLRDLRLGTTATVTFEGVTGQLVGMAYDNVVPAEAENDLAFTLHGPDGEPVPDAFFGTQPWNLRYGTQTVRLPETGRYRLDVRRYNTSTPDVDSLDLWLSTPKVSYVADPEQRSLPLDADWPGQAIVLRYPIAAGELVVQGEQFASWEDQTSDWCPGFRRFSVDATPVQPWDLGAGVYDERHWGLLSPVAGTVSATWTPCRTTPLREGTAMRTHRVATADIAIGGPSAALESPADPGDRIRFRFTATAGQRVEFFHEYAPRERVCCPSLHTDDGTLVSPESDGTTYVLPVTGTYHLLFGRDTGTRTIGVREVHGNG